ncbi:hypothetical protein CSE16_13825 [Solibacillus sp. R5-41]|uniref:competence type IV pilus minor pilin ComGD n=1 Tax=Solibacillus sp. R5-41 TaxID=2048654 RepID=UPI000C1247C5|nr:competence type IV pilus minor pilin ComGD [Solibacillus sp. R5-41]ATP41042.1 hypothetical protein CSE16_13825 [Solibacillus sp. R5-41]
MGIKRSLRNEQGFTLMEMLVVLAVIMILCSSILYFSHDKFNRLTVLKTMDEVEILMRMAQMKAIEEQRPVIIDIYDNTELVIKYFVGQEILYRSHLPEGMQLYLSAPNPRLYFRTNGNLQSFGSMAFHYEGEIYSYHINIGKGRVTRNE